MTCWRETLADDKIEGGEGDDVVIGGEADDILIGSNGNDKLFGGVGDDIFIGGAGFDEFHCDDGVDTILDFNSSESDLTTSDCELTKTNSTSSLAAGPQ